ncbi:MAG: dihydrolipoyllysine-residue succinyltransferase [Chthoniobacterales bacterium]|nr:dihydrolipoyllysine-residue succinyltransferase [Chthoniobacterales bacterium]
MKFEVKVPSVGESISTGVLSVWHKKNGESVCAGEILFTIETDKISTEVTATETGILECLVQEGEEVKIGQIVAYIQPAEASSPSPQQPMPSGGQKLSVTPAKGDTSSPATVECPASKSFVLPPSPPPPPKLIVEPFEPQLKAASRPDPRTTRKKLSPLRRKIATQLVAAQHNAAILTTFNECDMSAAIRLRKEMQEEFLKRFGVKLGFMSIFIKAVVDALKQVPALNSRMDGDDLVINHYYDIGVAVGTDRGLIVPVLRDCDQKSFGQLEQELADCAKRAREGKITLEELQGGVFSISNGGVYGSLMSTPILNPPQSGILGMHKIQERPVAIDGKIEIRPMMYLALSYDHRVVDGKEAVTFLVRVKECVENPARMLLGI